MRSSDRASQLQFVLRRAAARAPAPPAPRERRAAPRRPAATMIGLAQQLPRCSSGCKPRAARAVARTASPVSARGPGPGSVLSTLRQCCSITAVRATAGGSCRRRRPAALPPAAAAVRHCLPHWPASCLGPASFCEPLAAVLLLRVEPLEHAFVSVLPQGPLLAAVTLTGRRPCASQLAPSGSPNQPAAPPP